MKRYIVFLKQVPLSTKVEIDPVTKTLKRSSALTRTNPDDLHALQTAVNLKKKTGAEIVAVSMGPEMAVEVLREALQYGADKAVLLSSRAFAGSDTLCTSKSLAAAARKIGDYDLLFFGKMAVDGDTAQVGPEVAGQLDIPQITQLTAITAISDTSVSVTRNAGCKLQHLEVKMPCAIMVSRENCELENVTLRAWLKARQQPITRWNEHDLGLSSDEIGLCASPTQVVATEVPQHDKVVEWIEDGHAVMDIIENNVLCQTK